MITYANNVTISSIYNFVDDIEAGAVGTVQLGAILPQNNNQFMTIMNINVVAKSTLTSATGAATLSFGLKSTAGYYPFDAPVVVTKPVVLMGVNLIGAFNSSVDAEGQFQPVQGALSASNPLKVGYKGSAWYVIMVIGTEALTAGELQININCNVTSL